MKRQQETVGSIVQIHINDEFYVYAQILPHGLLAFLIINPIRNCLI